MYKNINKNKAFLNQYTQQYNYETQKYDQQQLQLAYEQQKKKYQQDQQKDKYSIDNKKILQKTCKPFTYHKSVNIQKDQNYKQKLSRKVYENDDNFTYKQEQFQDYKQKKQDKFNLTYFKHKKHQIQDKKTHRKKINQLNQKISLQKIQQKIKKYIITPISTTKSDKFNSQQKDLQLSRQTYKYNHSKTNSLSSSMYIEKIQSPNKYTQSSNSVYIKPLTLKKKIHLLQQHQNSMKEQLLMKQNALKYQEKSLEKQEKSFSTYKNKLDKIFKIRRIHQKQKQVQQKQRNIFLQTIRDQKLRLKASIVGGRSNLSLSRISINRQKQQKANYIRHQHCIHDKQVKSFEKNNVQQKRLKKQCVKQCQKAWIQSIKSFNDDKKLSINQRKLQQLSKQIYSLEKQKGLNDTFYHQKQTNLNYRNRIKDKKMQLQKKVKQYKKNLMIILNKQQVLNLSQNQENQQQYEIKVSKIQDKRKKRQTVSTQPDTFSLNGQLSKYKHSVIVSNRN